ncbi:hypothetical protein NQ317_002226 [Molorchus minor]|uniref:Uncharacterized protein n=1 Tax=Molorchus minor TaxID=1323400 RepID=A0ABQ9JS51_9CUCU|nr:hypothetical protein NQ317_002226 [Molorchus minor]
MQNINVGVDSYFGGDGRFSIASRIFSPIGSIVSTFALPLALPENTKYILFVIPVFAFSAKDSIDSLPDPEHSQILRKDPIIRVSRGLN